MKQNLTIKSLLAAAACSLGLLSVTRADDSRLNTVDEAPVTADLSLLGQTHGTVSYSRINLDGTSADANRYALELNQAVADGFDAVVGYDYLRTDAIAGVRHTRHTTTAALRAFSTAFAWGKPYAEAGLGHVWGRTAGARDNSLLWKLAAGAEFRAGSRATVTPYVQYVETPDLAGTEGVWSGGVKASYWIDRRWAVTAGLERDDEQNTAFMVGTNFRY